MKAVVYHSNKTEALGGVYRDLFKGFKRQCEEYGLTLVHLTTRGHEGWGHENYYFDLNPKNCVLNREITFCEYLKDQSDLVWFTEADCLILKMFPLSDADCVLLTRKKDDSSLNMAWRLGNKKALPLFEVFRDETEKTGFHEWTGDARAFRKVHLDMGLPMAPQNISYLGVNIELRDYSEYIKGKPKYTQHFPWIAKGKLLKRWGFNSSFQELKGEITVLNDLTKSPVDS